MKQWLWCAVDANVLDILVQPHRNANAANPFLTQLIARFGKPRVVVSNCLTSAPVGQI
ncbi:DDE-type integrase/transposase/recombinase [Pseudosulfitobacter pseudonitzschiae]|uniref:DDE-type integrase/transposase/recombinase n=1 Tax=Pseudosulfitobacter pseudonitzschiae TaxID=1402135 RepID=UPI001AF85889|nr:DDE-type integrase/transposase/recombinase [Pseudosulfitobacter pseudonitzschiae]MBM1817342.1 IS6 family transposase [Pseudosulfitobacter pseudonitzschiae]MBM1834353.1 IS6 family transposase [Pseudosulfitobacter pseudonitzschiae]MBM1839218.1 IS6 family transposase [Pseudosulfitobacter pseudonitzschiae]MBM1844068.1 IS6 family transposase [Pseudosulfitobacter pseudonitzschiae]MBM1848903.1 IS6 family transposase [Pseudosulfitobacter pseudonitzschiae]